MNPRHVSDHLPAARFDRSFRADLGRIVAGLALLLAQAGSSAAQSPAPADSIEAILGRFVTDYTTDLSLREDVTFGVFVGPDHWHVVARAARDSVPASARLVRGVPPDPTFHFTLDYPTLVRIDRGEINAETAMVRGLASDPALMSTGSSPDFRPGPGTMSTLLSVAFHFWTRGTPEVIPFGPSHTRFVHGTDAVVLYYEPGLRTGWFHMTKGQHANSDPRIQVNPFPTLLVITRGRGAGRIGGKEMDLGEGNAVLIPAGVRHEFWNPFDEPVQGLLIMFGRGA